MEEFFEDAKGQLGMAQYEARSWTSWHHHMSLVALAHLYVTQTRRDLKRKVPDLTLDMAMRLLRAALPRPQLTLKDADSGEALQEHPSEGMCDRRWCGGENPDDATRPLFHQFSPSRLSPVGRNHVSRHSVTDGPT